MRGECELELMHSKFNIMQFHNYKTLRPTFTQKTLRVALAVFDFSVTQSSFRVGYLLKPISSGVILRKIVHKHAGIYSPIP